MKKITVIATILAAALFGTVAGADSAPATSVASKPKLLDNLRFSYVGFYKGPQITKPYSSYQPTADGAEDETTKQVIESSLTLGYKLSPDVSISAIHNFNLYPLGKAKDKPALDMVYGSPAFKIAHTKLWDNKQGVTLAGAFRFYYPLTRSAHDSHLFTQLRTDESLNYDLQGTRWSLGMDFTQRLWIYSSDVAKGTSGLTSYYFYFGPYTAYQASETVSARLGFDKEMQKPYADKQNFDSSANMSGSIGVSWDVHPKINISPSLSFNPLNMRTNAMQAYLQLIAKFL